MILNVQNHKFDQRPFLKLSSNFKNKKNIFNFYEKLTLIFYSIK